MAREAPIPPSPSVAAEAPSWAADYSHDVTAFLIALLRRIQTVESSIGDSGDGTAWTDITGKPETFPPTLPIASSGVTGLDAKQGSQDAAINSKETVIPAGTTAQYWRGDKAWASHDKASVGLGSVDNTADTAKPVSTAQQTALNLKADLASPLFTGDPRAPTPAAADNDTSVATTAFVKAQGYLTAVPATYAPLASPVFTGNPTGPTPAPGDADTSLATTAFVAAAVVAAGGASPSNANPSMPGVAAPGTSALYARGDHVHPSDTAKLSLTGGTLTGDLTMTKTFPYVTLIKSASGENAGLWSRMNGKARWFVSPGDASPETGANVGSDYTIYRYSDAGDYLGAPMAITRSTGNVAIAQSLAVYQQLSVSGNVYVNVQGTTSGTNYSMPIFMQASGFENTIYTQAYHTPGVVAAYMIQVSNGSAKFDHSGAILINGNGYKPGGGVWGDSSDARIKTVLGEYTSGTEAILGLRPVRYTFKGNDTEAPPTNLDPRQQAEGVEGGDPVLPYRNSSHHLAASQGTAFVGLIAQEVEPIMPELITRRAGYIDGEKVEDLRNLDTSALIFALVNCCQELHARIESLEAKP